MVKTLLGKKVGMTQVFDDSGSVIPVTALLVGPCVVVQKNERSGEGEATVQLGFDDRKRKNTPKPLQGHFDKAGVAPKRVLKEVVLEEGSDCEVGQEITVEEFDDVSVVNVTGKSKGRGFAGVVKRHGFSGGPESHGSKFHRIAGSVGPGTYPGRVIKGRKMPGRMGNERITGKNLKVIKVDVKRNLLLVKGAVPGSKGGDVEISKFE